MRPIPISAVKQIADEFGYDQVVVIARKVGQGGGERVTTYGASPAHCEVAKGIGDFIRYKIMGWEKDKTITHEDKTRRK